MPQLSDHAARAVELVAPYCDVAERLPFVPPSARIRGVWFRVFINELAERGLLEKYEAYFPGESWSGLQFYWVGDYLVRIALAGALVGGPESVGAGMYELNRGNAARFATSLLGRTLFRLLSRDPLRLLEQGIASRRQTMDYGRWSVSFPKPNEAAVRIEEEYIWIDPNVLASFVGTIETIGRSVEAHAEMTARFDGVIHLALR